eukprot:Hpha_TRINITY_DN15292_c8_g9::TRINITY_DN15292_c8_g9_i1::g.68358::m.68358
MSGGTASFNIGPFSFPFQVPQPAHAPQAPHQPYPAPSPQVSVTTPDAAVRTHSLSTQQLNDQRGRVVGMQVNRVRVDFGENVGEKAIRPENLRVVTGFCWRCEDRVQCKGAADGGLACARCANDFVEEVRNEQDEQEAREFRGQPQPQQPPPQPQPQQHVPMQGFPFNFGGMAQGMGMAMGGGGVGVGLQGLFDHLEQMQVQMAQLASQHEGGNGPPPASAAAVAALRRGRATKEILEGVDGPCAVCQDEMQEGDEYVQMPCGHLFHNDCISPWLARHNSCPTCRHELETDDPDYEAQKRRREALDAQRRAEGSAGH